MQMLVLVGATVLLALWPARGGAQCKGDFNGDGEVTINEIITAVNNALDGCPLPGPRFVDNGDGTLTDNTTGLVWEMKSADGGIHDAEAMYTWTTGAPFDPDGTAFTSFLAALNSPPCFAGHCDWRLPTAAELQGLVDFARYAPAIDPAFNTGCEPGCTTPGCSCTALENYWSATTPADAGVQDNAWTVDFNYGYVSLFEKALPAAHVRAVRAGG